MMKIIVIALLGLSLVHCSSKGFQRGVLHKQLGLRQSVVVEEDLQEILKTKAQLPKPFRMAVYFKEPPQSRKKQTWRWTEQDKNMIDRMEASMKEQRSVSSVFPLLPSLVQDNSLRAIRSAAARQGADAVLVISGVSEMDSYVNNAAFTYSLLVTALFVPGSEIDSLFMANATLWDVRNEFLYLAAEAEAQTNYTYIPAFKKRDRDIMKEAKDKAMAKLEKNLIRMVKGDGLALRK